MKTAYSIPNAYCSTCHEVLFIELKPHSEKAVATATCFSCNETWEVEIIPDPRWQLVEKKSDPNG